MKSLRSSLRHEWATIEFRNHLRENVQNQRARNKRHVRFSLLSLLNYFLLRVIWDYSLKTQRIFAIPQSRFIHVYSNRSTVTVSEVDRQRLVVSKIHPFALTSRIRISFCTVSKSCFLIPGTFSFAEARKRTADSRKQQHTDTLYNSIVQCKRIWKKDDFSVGTFFYANEGKISRCAKLHTFLIS